MKPITAQAVQPAVERDSSALNPTATRYGWCPFGDINLAGPDGTINLYVQPPYIASPEGETDNPYHRMLPKGQLIPFPTFSAPEQQPSPDMRDASGRAMLVTTMRTITAYDAASSVLSRHSDWGFVLLNSLQGMSQEDAFHCFQVVHPFEYPLGQLVNALDFDAQDRIDATEPIEMAPGYTIQPLPDHLKPAARQLAAEMSLGANIAFDLATETLNVTEQSMTQKFSGGNGKSGPDALDKRLTQELGRELPKLVGAKTSETDAKIDFLVNRAVGEDQKAEIERLRAENNALKAQALPESGPTFNVGDTVTAGGRTGTVVAKPFGRYKVQLEGGETEMFDKFEIT